MEKSLKLYLYFNLGFNLYQKQVIERLNFDKSPNLREVLKHTSTKLNEILFELLQNDSSSNLSSLADSDFGIEDVIEKLSKHCRDKKELLLYLGQNVSKLTLPYYLNDELKSDYIDLIYQIKIKMNRLELPSRTMAMLDNIKQVNPESHIDAVTAFHDELLVDIVSKYDMDFQVLSSNQKVFVVHGHDDSAKYEIAHTLEKLGFEPIILHEKASGGKTIIEKIETYSDVNFVVVLYTQCDLGRDKKALVTEEMYRARQNVVFEHGYLIGKLGRKRVHALLKGDIETPGDISGVIYTKMDSDGGWKLTLANEMKEAGLLVDMNKFYS